ncbi:TerC family protein [Varunaivibrio sulfuroxidans]|uniref:Putative tellurium resistance membrane protein TerC n=1 Tax=Varunaivibrio sulfuroxidans TaxID=1773489 RepID=A0A4R3JG30_9PROT|nr:TerC family protein [Varunaivibrio sulfuroxidans]TCS63660.1 putative tellurium resistance membrane protein TerC [Varunaivibrio sulfuroxidans]WES30202.1 TerC family protein [Varunaivibrio sulfuroxidans]
METAIVTLIATPETWISLATLISLEVVLGIDNLVFIAILVDRLPKEHQTSARRGGIALALVTRLMLLFTLAWLAKLTAPLLVIADHPLSLRDMILIAGGLFLLVKATREIHERLEEAGAEADLKRVKRGIIATIVQIALIDIIFSLDSVITAVGMVNEVSIMATAITVAVVVMLWASGPLSAFVSRHPTVKMLAMSFLLLIGMALVADGMGFHIPKGYLYFAMGFSVSVEALNLWAAARERKAKHAGE